jgi:hypothetical protein
VKPLRCFYLPNEIPGTPQYGPRKAFAQMQAEGIFSEVESYSYLLERQRFASQEEALADLLAAARAFAPDLVFWQHLNRSYPVDRAFLQALKAIPSRPKFVWHDPDPYGKLIKPVDPVMKMALAECDAAVLVGLGYLADEVRKAGARRVLFAPHSYDDERFAKPWQPTLERRFDAIMIANLTCLKRIPFLYLPGGRNRKVMSRLFHRAYGERYAVFGGGQGWQGEPYCLGPLPFEQQETMVRNAWLTINWGQFDKIAMYSSDRLPISLITGVPHITNHQRGYEHLFPGAKGLYFVHSPEEALDVADMLLSKPREHLIEIGEQGIAYAREHLHATKVYRDLVLALRQQLFGIERAPVPQRASEAVAA